VNSNLQLDFEGKISGASHFAENMGASIPIHPRLAQSVPAAINSLIADGFVDLSG